MQGDASASDQCHLEPSNHAAGTDTAGHQNTTPADSRTGTPSCLGCPSTVWTAARASAYFFSSIFMPASSIFLSSIFMPIPPPICYSIGFSDAAGAEGIAWPAKATVMVKGKSAATTINQIRFIMVPPLRAKGCVPSQSGTGALGWRVARRPHALDHGPLAWGVPLLGRGALLSGASLS